MLHQKIATLTQEAALRLHAGNLPEARALYSQICRLNKENAHAWMMLGAINGDMGITDEAVSCLRTSIGLQPDFPQAHYNLGNVFRRQGKYQDALACLERAVEIEPGYAEAWQMLGGVYLKVDRSDDAQACCRRLLELRPDSADAHVKLGTILLHSGKDQEAVESFKRATGLEPSSFQGWHLLACTYERMKMYHEAENCARRALNVKPDFYEAHIILANTLRAQSRLDEAIESYRRAVNLKPDLADIHLNMGSILMERGQATAAAFSFRRAAELKPDNARAFNYLGLALHDAQDYLAAIVDNRKVLELQPNAAGTYSNLGLSYHSIANYTEAEKCFSEAVRIAPDSSGTWNNLAGTFNAQGKSEEAIVAFQRALALKPDFGSVRSNMLLSLNYTTLYSPEKIFAEHKAWEKTYVPRISHVQSYRNTPDPTRRIRIGYVSPDFHSHSVSFFIKPILKNHDPCLFDAICYADVRSPDSVTQQLRAHAQGWRDICGISNASVIQTIKDDGIDLLVDLAGHTGYNRLDIFACKPAPVQISYLGYPNTTGLSTIDYRLTDGWADPPGMTDMFHTETLIRLPQGFLCYSPDATAPAVEPLPALQAGHVTFGSFNILPKITPAVIALWASILRALPQSRLKLKNKSMSDSVTREQMYEKFSAHGITRDRIDLHGRQAMQDEHMATYHTIDIALDPFPYNGTTTTCEALWMGAPVITLAGQAHAGRVGVSILNQVGLSACIAETLDEYLAIAMRLANSLEELKQMRSELRGRMMNSPLCDASGFTKMLEEVYRKMWGKWCAATEKNKS